VIRRSVEGRDALLIIRRRRTSRGWIRSGRSGETGRSAEDDGGGGGGDRPAHAGHRAADTLGTRQRTSRVRSLDADGLPAPGFR
jgi:hypothetical protein